MVTDRIRIVALALIAVAGLLALAHPAFAADGGDIEASQPSGHAATLGEGVREGLIALAAAVAMLGAALGTGKVQAAIGAGGTGTIAEKPELFVSIVILIAIPETIIVLGFVMSLLILNKI